METTRDIVVIVFGIGATATMAVLLLMAFSIYRRLVKILDSLHTTVQGVEAFSRDVLGPITRAATMIASAWRLLSGVFGDEKKERRDDAA